MATASAILSTLRSDGDISDYRKLHWEGSFEDYLEIVAGLTFDRSRTSTA